MTIKSVERFFNIKKEPIKSGSKKEIETFMFLMETEPRLALDFINCWLKLRNCRPLSDQILRSEQFLAIIDNNRVKKKKKQKIKEPNDS